MEDPRPDFPGTDRFEIRRQLGEGAMGTVYEAFDRERGQPVALKTLLHFDAASLYRLKQEFRQLADVQHPNLVTLYELVSAGDRWFFTMQIVEGRSFIDHVRTVARGTGEHGSLADENAATVDPSELVPTADLRPAALRAAARAPVEATVRRLPEGSEPASSPAELAAAGASALVRMRAPRTRELVSPVARPPAPAAGSPPAAPLFDERRLRPALRQLAEGTHALHVAGKLHRDVKPSNVLVTADGRVVLLDFGLVSDRGPADRAVDAGLVVGTPGYMSPEQAAGDPLGPASDWYSIGVMLFEALTGRLPFDGTIQEVLGAKQINEAPVPSSYVAGLPKDLEALCRALLALDPAARPAGAEVLRRLGVAGAPSPTPTAPAGGAHGAFVGRERELEALHAAFETTLAGNPGIAWVEGRSGMGKSELVARFLEELARREPAPIVLRGRCYERESVPYKAFDSLVDDLGTHLRQVTPAVAQALMPRDPAALGRLFPVLRWVEAVAQAQQRPLDTPDPHALRRRGFAALRELLDRLAARAPLVLHLDDLQWGDLDSAALLIEILRAPDAPPLLVIGSYRSEQAAPSDFLGAVLQAPEITPPHVGVRRVEVGPLALADAERLARTLLGDGRHDTGRAASVARESEGNPLFVAELVRHIEAADAAPDASLDLDVSLDSVLRARVARLAPEARELLEIVAVAGRPIAQAIAFRATVASGDEHATLAILRAGNLARTGRGGSGDDVETYHDRVRELVAGDLGDEARKGRHLALAQALEHHGGSDPEALMTHYRGAGDRARAGAYAVQAAEQAARALAFDRAAALYRAAMELDAPEAVEERRRLQGALGEALANAGRGAEAAAAFLAATEGALAAERLELQRRAAEQFLVSGHVDQGLAALRSVLKATGMKLAPTPLRALLSLLWRRAKVRLRGLEFEERDASQISPERLAQIGVCWSVAVGLGMVDTIRGADFQARHLLLALRAGEPYRLVRALAAEAAYASTAGQSGARRANMLVEAASDLAGRVPQPHARACATLAGGIAAFCQGRWVDGRDQLQSAIETLRERCIGVAWETTTALGFQVSCLFYLGELGALARHVNTHLSDSLARGDLYAASTLRTSFGELCWLAADDVDGARREIRAAEGQWSRMGFQMQHYWSLRASGYVDLYAGDAAAAHARVRAAWRGLEQSQLLRAQIVRVQMVQLRAQSALAAAAGEEGAERERLLAGAARDAARLAREGVPWSVPIASLVRAGLEAARGADEEAAATLASAAARFDAAHMALYAASCRRMVGVLTGGETGRSTIEEADRTLAGLGARSPARMAALIAPGFGAPPRPHATRVMTASLPRPGPPRGRSPRE